MRYKDLFENAIKRLKNNQNPLDVQILLQKSFFLSKEDFWVKKDQVISSKTGLQKFYRYFKRLQKGEPVQYITKSAEFFSMSLYVKKGVLIPRPETEILVEQALQVMKEDSRVLDIGAGSGAISIALAKNSHCSITALEKSESAISILKKNIKYSNLRKRIKIIHGDLFSDKNSEKFDIIVSNPPYIKEKDWENLDDNVKIFEPKIALVGGQEGTELIEKIVQGAEKHLKNGGYLIIEIGYDQNESVPLIFHKHHYSDIKLIDDYSGIGRVVCGRLLS